MRPSHDTEIVATEGATHREAGGDPLAPYALGTWWWVTDTDEDRKADKWLGCITHLGSNYLKLESVQRGYVRIHIDELHLLRAANDATEHIAGQIQKHQNESRRIIREIQALAQRLGLNPLAISNTGQDRALAVLTGTPDMDGYKNQLIAAKDKALPELFKALEENNKELARWMTAETLPLEAGIGPLKETIEVVKDRIFNVSLYAGLTEQTVKVADGKPAPIDAVLHVMQNRLYMDEECLVDYKAGGMEFRDIGKFDKWIAKPKNRNRLLPFPRTLVAMRVRRYTKEREYDSPLSAFIKFGVEQADKLTFLYIRNGDQVWRLSCDLEFGSTLFPDAREFDDHEPMMAERDFSRHNSVITVPHYEELVKQYDEKKAKLAAWRKAHPKAKWIDEPHDLSDHYGDPRHRYKPFDTSNVYFDDINKGIEADFKKYNHIALLIQGLFDRSEALHPHGPVQTWKPEGFAKAVKLVNDYSSALYHGDPPDFEAYRARLNASLRVGSYTVGQEVVWLQAEAAKQNERNRQYGYRHGRHISDHTFYRPYGNPGPGRVAQVVAWRAKTKHAVYRWDRERQTYRRWEADRRIPCSLAVSADKLLNISAYKVGDFKQFYADPRTRADYLKWAPLLLTAEDHHVAK